MNAQKYDRWYETPYGSWIGGQEAGLIYKALMPQPGESLLDIGCGTGFFTRKLAGLKQGCVAGIDANPDCIEYANRRDHEHRISYAVADARHLPCPDRRFDLVICIAALCFMQEERAVIREMLRVARRRFAVGLLNRFSLLWVKKGIGGGRGEYRGARWHTMHKAKALFSGLPVQNLTCRTIIHIPVCCFFARGFERLCPSVLPSGGFMLIAGDVARAGTTLL